MIKSFSLVIFLFSKDVKGTHTEMTLKMENAFLAQEILKPLKTRRYVCVKMAFVDFLGKTIRSHVTVSACTVFEIF